MEQFIANSGVYTNRLNSYTADDEFIANKRVHVTNEIPPQDLFDQAHSKLKNEYWEWFIGSTSLTYDGINYNMMTSGIEYFDEDGLIISPSIAKYVNGIRSKDYGPTPYYTFGKVQYKDDQGVRRSKEDYILHNVDYHRLEVNGTFMPEMDFMLHEGYRYLETLYPNHPDYIEILTTNEINDEITQAATLIHYNPNNIFFDWLATELDYNLSKADLPLAWSQEATKLKVRNLTNHAFRRKFYGAKTGYKQFGNEVFQHILLYPVAEYLPFKPGLNEGQYIIGEHRDFKWYNNIYNKPDELQERLVNIFDRLYHKPFRLVDWNNASFDYLHEWEPPVPIYGTAHSTPLSNYDVYEYPASRQELENQYTIQKDFHEGQKVWINQDDVADDGNDKYQDRYEKGDGVFINTMFCEDGYKVVASLNYISGELVKAEQIVNVRPDYVTHIQVDGPVYPMYTSGKVFPSMEKMLTLAINYNNKLYMQFMEDKHLDENSWDRFSLDNRAKFFDPQTTEGNWAKKNSLPYDLFGFSGIIADIEQNTFNRSFNEIVNLARVSDDKSIKLISPKIGNFILEPHQDGNLHIPAEQMLTSYTDWLNVKVKRTDWYHQTLEIGNTPMSDNAYFNEKDLILLRNNEKNYISEITGIEGGELEFEIYSAERWVPSSYVTENMIEVPQEIYDFNHKEFSEYGVVLQLSKNNDQSAGKWVVLFGKPEIIKWDAPDKLNKIAPTRMKLRVIAIPRVKTYELLISLNPLLQTQLNQKFDNLIAVFGTGSSLTKDNIYKIHYTKYAAIIKENDTLAKAVHEILDKNRNGDYVHPNDSYWKKVKKSITAILGYFELAPVKQHQLTDIYNLFVKETDKSEIIKQPDIFEANFNSMMAEIEKYETAYFEWLAGIVAVDLKREYYTSIDVTKQKDEVRAALGIVKGIDTALDNVLPNRGFLLKPLPDDIYMKTPSNRMEASYSLLTRQDSLIAVIEPSFDSFGELVIYKKLPQFGTAGIINTWTFGSLSAASVVIDNMDIDNNIDSINAQIDLHTTYNGVIYNTFYETFPYAEDKNGYRWGIDYLKEYPLESYRFITLNEDIFKAIAESTDPQKFSYGAPSWLELFLDDYKKFNMIGYLPEYHKVDIRSIIKEGTNIVSFVDEVSQARFACLQTGDQVIGNGIEDDIFISEIDNKQHQITVIRTSRKPNEAEFKFTITADKVLTYLCKLNLFDKDISKDFWRYRKELCKNGVIDSGSLFRHGVYPIKEGAKDTHYYQLSNAYLNGISDVSKFVDTWKANLKTYPEFKMNFNKIVWFSHNDGVPASTYHVPPSVINCANKLYIDVGTYKLYDYDPNDKDKQNGYIMKKDILDYVQDEVPSMSRASDVVNVGVSITAGTVGDGSITKDPTQKDFTDPELKLKFAVDSQIWSSNTVPTYIDIGIGNLGDGFFNRKVTEEQEKTKDIEERTYWNWSVYDDIRAGRISGYENNQDEELKTMMWSGLSGLAAQGLDLEKLERSPYTTIRDYIADASLGKWLDHIDKPIMRLFLGEYEVQKMIQFPDVQGKKYTTLQFSVIKQVFKDIKKNNELRLKVINHDFFICDIFNNTKENWIKVVPKDDANIFKYEGEWTPKVELRETEINGQKTMRNYVIYPKEWIKDTYTHYYSITKDFSFSNIGSDPIFGKMETVSYEKGSVLIWSHETKKYQYNTFILAGLIGDIVAVQAAYKEEERERNDLIYLPEIPGEKDNCTLKRIMLIKLLAEAGVEEITVSNAGNTTITDILLASTEAIESYFLKTWLKKNNWNFTDRNIFWFWYTLPNMNTDNISNPWNTMISTNIPYGSAMALYVLNGKVWVSLLKENKMLFLLPAQNPYVNNKFLIWHPNFRDNEYLTFLGKFGETALKTFGDENKNHVSDYIFLTEHIKKYNNTFNVNYINLLEGSVDVKIQIIPNFKTTGIEYVNGQITDISGEIDITEDNIYYDMNNKKLYTYNERSISGELWSGEVYLGISGGTISGWISGIDYSPYSGEAFNHTQYAIKQEDNKFFKNLLYLYGTYQDINTQVNGKFQRVPQITAINGMNFDSDMVSLFDRILEVEHINIRSLYNADLEATLFSSYCNLKGLLKGFTLDTDNKPQYLSIGYKYSYEPVQTSNKLKFSTELKKITPVRENEDGQQVTFPDSNITWGEMPAAMWPDTKEELPPPEIKHYDVKEQMSEGGDAAFLYYKNLLVLEGKVDINEPSVIDFSENPKLADALTYIRTGDRIEGITPLSSSSQTSYIPFYSSLVGGVKFADYQMGYLIAANENRFAYTPAESILNAGMSGIVPSAPMPNMSGENVLESLGWDEYNKKWVVSMSISGQSTYLYALGPEDINGNNTHWQPYANETGINIEETDILDIQDVSFGDDRYDNDPQYRAYVQARDLAIISGTLISTPPVQYNVSGLWNGTKPVVEIDGKIKFNGTGVWKTEPISVGDDYKILQVDIKKNTPPAGTTNGWCNFGIHNNDNIAAGKENIGNGSVAEQIWWWNKYNSKWVLSESPDDFPWFIEDYNLQENVHITTYLMHPRYIFNDNNQSDPLLWGMKFWDLPKPETSENTVTCAVILKHGNDKIQLKMMTKDSAQQMYIASNMYVSTPDKVKQDQYLRYGPYDPFVLSKNVEYKYIEQHALQQNSRKFVVSNSMGDMAIIMGKVVFFYTKTKKFVLDSTGKVTAASGRTIANHWKRATLPSKFNTVYKLFDEFLKDSMEDRGMKHAYDYVYNQYMITIAAIKKGIADTPGNNEQPIIKSPNAIALEETLKWLEKNAPQAYFTEESIPINIIEKDVKLHQTASGKIPQFKSGLLTQWTSPQDTVFELGLTTAVYLKKQNYMMYLADYYQYLLGAERMSYLFDFDCIKEVNLSNSALTIQTKNDDIIALDLKFTTCRADIENYNNWNISNIDEDYLVNTNDAYISSKRTIGVDDKYYVIDMFPNQTSLKAIRVNERFVSNNVQIITGYIDCRGKYYDGIKTLFDQANALKDDELKNSVLTRLKTLFPTKEGNLEQSIFPVIYYSENNGMSFTKAILPATGAMAGANILESSASKLIMTDQIFQMGNEIRVVFKEADAAGFYSDTFYTTFTINENPDNSSIRYNLDMIPIVDKDDLKLKTIRSFEIERCKALILKDYGNGDVEKPNPITQSDGIAEHYDSVFLIQIPYHFQLNEEMKISEVNSQSLRYNPSVLKADVKEYLRVLVSINPTILVEQPTKYLEWKDEYKSSFGRLLVPDFKIVDSITSANRLYSARECIQIEADGLRKAGIGIPAISEDNVEGGRKIYEYYDPYTTSQGETIYEYKEAKNSAIQIVKLCNEEGNYLAFRDSRSLQNYFDLGTMITENIEYASLVAAPILKPTFEALIDNSSLSGILNEIEKSTIKYVNFEGLNPILHLSLSDINPTLYSMMSSGYFYEWPMNGNDPRSVDDSYLYSSNGQIAGGDQSWMDLMIETETNEGTFIPILSPISDKYSGILVTAISGMDIISGYFVKDIRSDTLLVKTEHQNIVTLNCSMPYNFKNGMQDYSNVQLNLSGNVLEPFEQEYSLNSIYVPAKGYGGSIENESWDTIHPEENDYMAFKQENLVFNLLKNNNDEYIYIADPKGNLLTVRNGLFWMAPNIDTTEISWQKLIKKENTVKIYDKGNDQEDFYYNPPTEYKFWKLPASQIQIYTPKDIVYFNGNAVLNNSNNNEWSNPSDPYEVLTVLKIIKGGKQVEDFARFILRYLDSANQTLELPAGCRIEYDFVSEQLRYYASFFPGINTDLDGTTTLFAIIDSSIPPGFTDDIIRIEVTDTLTEQVAVKELKVAKKTAREYGLITAIESIDFYKTEKIISSTTDVKMTFDTRTLNWTYDNNPNTDNRSLKSYDNNIIVSNPILSGTFADDMGNGTTNKQKPRDYIITTIIQGYPIAYLELQTPSSKERIIMDVRSQNLEILVNKDWYKTDLKTEIETDKTIKLALYSEDNLISGNLLNDANIKYDGDRIEIKYKDVLFMLNFTKKSNNIVYDFPRYIYTYNKIEDADLITANSMGSSKTILVSGMYGRLIFNTPAYRNFKELIDQKGLMIEYPSRRIIKNGEKNSIIEVANNLTSLKLQNRYDEFSDGKKYFVKIKLLPLKTIYPAIKNLNDPNYIMEVSVLEKDLYGFDRVFINPNSYVLPPHLYNGVLYNQKNEQYYLADGWLNKDGYKVYICDETGKFTKPRVTNGEMTYVTLGDNTGDCRKDIYGNIDPRFNLPKPIYQTSLDWYLSEFYIKGQETNPFVLNIRIKDEYDIITQKFIQKTYLTQPKKFNGNIIYIPIENNYLTEVIPAILYQPNYSMTQEGKELASLVQDNEQKIINHTKGEVNIIVKGPDENYHFTDYMFLFGIRYKNQFSSNGDFLNYWINGTSLKNKLLLNFYLNTRENLIDRDNKDFAVVDITEMGVFDQYGRLCAYMTHPKAQYRSDQQHISYNCIIEEIR